MNFTGCSHVFRLIGNVTAMNIKTLIITARVFDQIILLEVTGGELNIDEFRDTISCRFGIN